MEPPKAQLPLSSEEYRKGYELDMELGQTDPPTLPTPGALDLTTPEGQAEYRRRHGDPFRHASPKPLELDMELPGPNDPRPSIKPGTPDLRNPEDQAKDQRPQGGDSQSNGVWQFFTAIIFILGISIIPGLAVVSCTSDKPTVEKTSPEDLRATLVAAMSKKLKREVIDLHSINAEDRWAYQLNDTCRDKACLVEATITEISRTKDGYLLFGEASSPDFSRTWKLRLSAKEASLGTFARRDQYNSQNLVLDQVQFQVIDSLAATQVDDDATVGEGESRPYKSTLSDESALLMIGRVLSVVVDDPKPAVEVAP